MIDDSSTPSVSEVDVAGAGAAQPGFASRRGAMAVRLLAVATALVLAVAIALVVVVGSSPPSVDELRRQAGLDGKRQLLIGVKDDQPGIAIRHRDGTFTGFDIDMAYLVAEDLDFRRSEVRFLSIESEDRARMQATDTDGSRVAVDLVIASYSVTPDREAVAGVTFSAPYLYTEQSVVTLASHAPVSTLKDLAGRRVCSLATATSETAADDADAILLSRKRISECFAALHAGQVEAVTTDAAILGGFVAADPTRLHHWDIGDDATEAWGINVGENDALRKLVDLALYRSRNDPSDARWEEAYDRNLRVEEPANRPAPLAAAQQPLVREPAVRQWPWERVGR